MQKSVDWSQFPENPEKVGQNAVMRLESIAKLHLVFE